MKIALINREWLSRAYANSLYRNAGYLILSNITIAATGLAFWIIVARLYAADAVGLSSAVISAMLLLAMLSNPALDVVLMRFLSGSGSKFSKMVNSCLTLGGAVSIILALVFVAGIRFWSPALLPIQNNPLITIAFIVAVVATTLNTLVHFVLVAQRRANLTFIRNLIFGVVRIIPVFFLAATQYPLGAFFSWIVALVLANIVGIVILIPRTQPGYHLVPTFSKEVLKGLSSFSLGNYAANLMWALPGLIFPFMIINLTSPTQNAYFSMCWSIANIIFTIPVSISLSLFAEGSYDATKLKENVRMSLKLALLITIPAVVLVLIMSPYLLLLFGSSYSEEGARLLRLLTLSALPLTINYIFLSIKRIQIQTRKVMALSSFIAAASLLVGYFLLLRMGINGIGVAWLIGQGIIGLVLVYKVIKI